MYVRKVREAEAHKREHGLILVNVGAKQPHKLTALYLTAHIIERGRFQLNQLLARNCLCAIEVLPKKKPDEVRVIRKKLKGNENYIAYRRQRVKPLDNKLLLAL